MTVTSMLGQWRQVTILPIGKETSSNSKIPIPLSNIPGQNSTTQANPDATGQTLSPQVNGIPPVLTDEERMKKHPWKYAGYSLFTAYLGSSREVVILRRFDQLHARVLLRMQDDIVMKEEEIQTIDKRLSMINDVPHINGSFRVDAGNDARVKPNEDQRRRSKLLDDLKTDIRIYDKTILNYRKLRSDPEPSQSNVENVQNYLHNWGYTQEEENKGPIWQPECQYIFKDGDLLELVPETKAPLRQVMEKWSSFMLGPWFRRQPKGTQCYRDFRSDQKQVSYQSDARIEGFVSFLSLLCGLFLLVGPLQLLSVIDDEKTKLDVICGLIAAFLVVMGVVMPARPWETLAATAAYSAVLMVFMQINHSSNAKQAE